MNTQTLLNNVSTIKTKNTVMVAAKEFLRALKQVRNAINKNDTRDILREVHCIVKGGKLQLIGTNSHIMVIRELKVNTKRNFEFLINYETATQLTKAITKHGEYLTINVANLEVGQDYGITEIIDGLGEKYINNYEYKYYTLDPNAAKYELRYPRVDHIIPDCERLGYQLNVKDTKKFVKQLREIKKNTVIDKSTKTRVVKLSVDGENKITIKDTNSELETHIDDIQVSQFAEEKFSIAFNIQYLIDVLKELKGACVMNLYSSLRPFLITQEDGFFKGIVTPVRTFD